jgi:putative membrane protein
MKVVTSLAAVLGLALLVGLIWHFGYAEIGRAVASAGWGVALVVLVRAAAVGGAGLGWWVLLRGTSAPPMAVVVVRFVREAINGLFPVAQVGGDFVGARLLTFFGLTGTMATASTIMDIAVQVVTLIVFTVVALWLLEVAGVGLPLVADVSIGIGIVTLALIGLFVALRRGAFNPLIRKLAAFADTHDLPMLGHVVGLGEDLRTICRDSRKLLASFLVHLLFWFVGALEVYVALHFMGYPVSLADAVAIEGISQAIRAAAFILPGGLGVQDGSFIALCAMFAIPAEVALALALLKRIADVVLGLPGLWAWHVLESRRVDERRAALAYPTVRQTRPE